MLEIVRELKRKHYTSTKAMTLVLARCLRCRQEFTILKQNFVKHNRRGRTHCQHCTADRYHYQTNTRIWRIWNGMKVRCKGTGHDKDKRNYSERGIEVCERWQSFENFYEDMHEGYSDDLTLERIDNNDFYCKANCRWASSTEQQANKRNNRVVIHLGERIHLAELCRRTGLSRGKITPYLNQGMTGDQAETAARNSTYGGGKVRSTWSTTSSTAGPDTSL